MDNTTSPKAQMDVLCLNDLIILKRFLEKANRSGIFLESEKYTSSVLHTKLDNIINQVYEKQKQKNKD